MTSRQLKEADFEKVVEFIDEGIQIALDVKKKTGEQKKGFHIVPVIYQCVCSKNEYMMLTGPEGNFNVDL